MKNLAVALGVLSALFTVEGVRAAPRPNVVFILADDLGGHDLGCYGSTFHKTPNIDALARRGLLFTQAYAANPLCSPTRASILTGQYPARLGLTAPVGHLPEVRLTPSVAPRGPETNKCLAVNSSTRLDTRLVTLSEVFKAGGYATGHFGKWHLGSEPYSPLQQGFDIDVPHWHGPGPAGSYVAPWKFPAALNFSGAPGEHIEDRMAREASNFIRAHKDRPFFLNYWAFSVHSPYDAKREAIDGFRATADEKVPQRNPLYAAMIQSLDDAVGTLVKSLEENGVADNTIVVFFSDNGGVNWQALQNEGLRGKGHPSQEFSAVPPTSNAPLRGGKASIYEGGTREPCLVVWPKNIQPGSRSAALISSVDWFPTLAEAAALPLPAGQVMDGQSFLPVLRGQKNQHREAIFNFFPHNVAASNQLPAASVRQGDWKLIRFFYDGLLQSHRYELYNLRDDRGETRDLSADQAPRVRELDALLTQFLHDTNALLPQPNPDFGKRPPGKVRAATEWTAGRDTALRLQNGALHIESKGADPWLFTREVPTVRGPFVLELRLQSEGAGAGEVRWTTAASPNFDRMKMVGFTLQHDGAPHDYRVEIKVDAPLTALRLDPGSAPGAIQLQALRLRDGEGKLIKEWRFNE